MQRTMTITLDEKVYEGLCRSIGEERIGRFIENLVRSHVVDADLEAGYRAMAADEEREKEASEWCDALTNDGFHEAR